MQINWQVSMWGQHWHLIDWSSSHSISQLPDCFLFSLHSTWFFFLKDHTVLIKLGHKTHPVNIRRQFSDFIFMKMVLTESNRSNVITNPCDRFCIVTSRFCTKQDYSFIFFKSCITQTHTMNTFKHKQYRVWEWVGSEFFSKIL